MQSSALTPTTQPDSAAGKLRAGARRLILIRHAKAVEEDAGGDHARPLSARGLEDASALAGWLLAQGYVAQQAWCSSAVRTRQTLAALTTQTPTLLADKLYLATAGEMLTILQSTDDAVTDVMMVGHNPGIHGLLALLAGEFAVEADVDRMILKFPTSACAILRFNAAEWRSITPRSGLLEVLRY
jgi:phosphohistidine phosphatase